MSEVLLQAEHIGISFGGVKAVQDVSFEIQKGEILGLIGPNGSGKSTCVNLISNVYKLDTGTIIFRGKALDPKDSIMARARMGITRTFQTPKPFTGMNVFESVFSIALLNNKNFREAEKKANDVLELTDLSSVKTLLSEKLPIEKRKWLDLARALVTDPALIMLDEVLAGLNQVETADSLELVRQINREKGTTFLFIEHNIRAVLSLCTRVIVLNEGRILATGDPVQVMKRPDVIAAYIGGKKDAVD